MKRINSVSKLNMNLRVKLYAKLSAGLMAMLVTTSCGINSSPEFYDLEDLTDIQLSSTNHPHGFGQSQCFSCHNNFNIHRVDRVGGDIELARELVRTDGIQSCSVCHGDNGVTSP